MGENVREHVLHRAERAVKPRHRRLAAIVLDGVEDVVGDLLRPDHESLHRLRQPLLREALRLGEAGLDGVDADPRGRSSAATVRENASCACFDAEYGPLGGPATTPGTETMLTTWEGAAARGRGGRR